MAEGAMPKPLQDLLAVAVLSWVAGAMVLGWLNNRGRRRRGHGASADGWLGDDGSHHHGWGDGGHASDGGGHDGDAGGGGGH